MVNQRISKRSQLPILRLQKCSLSQDIHLNINSLGLLSDEESLLRPLGVSQSLLAPLRELDALSPCDSPTTDSTCPLAIFRSRKKSSRKFLTLFRSWEEKPSFTAEMYLSKVMLKTSWPTLYRTWEVSTWYVWLFVT